MLQVDLDLGPQKCTHAAGVRMLLLYTLATLRIISLFTLSWKQNASTEQRPDFHQESGEGPKGGFLPSSGSSFEIFH